MLAVVTMEFKLANLLYCFDWELPEGMGSEDMSMEQTGGLTVHKKTPLLLVPTKDGNGQEISAYPRAPDPAGEDTGANLCPRARARVGSCAQRAKLHG